MQHHNTKIINPGKNAYEKQLIRLHRREVLNFLHTQRELNGEQKRFIMDYYDSQIKYENIILVHTHSVIEFLEALCTGQLEKLYNYTSCRA